MSASQFVRGQIYGLIGPNGAGKTTFFNVITGLYTPDSGSFELAGKPYAPTEVHKVAQAGIARTFQNIRLFPDMTALENVMVGRHVRTKATALGAMFRTRTTSSGRGWDQQTFAGVARLRRYRELRRLTRRAPSPTATSAVWRSHARWRPTRSCSPSTNLLPE